MKSFHLTVLCVYIKLACFFPPILLDLMATPNNGGMEQLTTPLRVLKPLHDAQQPSRGLPQAIVSPMVHVAETTNPAGVTGLF